MQTTKTISLSEDKKKLVIEELGIELKKDNKIVGTRKVYDEYDLVEINRIMEYVQEELTKLQKAADQSRAAIDDHQKKFEKREENKIKEFKAMFGKAQAYDKAREDKAKLQNFLTAIERDEKDLKELKDAIGRDGNAGV